jgi:hypothetical protein
MRRPISAANQCRARSQGNAESDVRWFITDRPARLVIDSFADLAANVGDHADSGFAAKAVVVGGVRAKSKRVNTQPQCFQLMLDEILQYANVVGRILSGRDAALVGNDRQLEFLLT